MWLTILIGILSLCALLKYLYRSKIDLSHVPGIHRSAWWMIFDPPDPAKAHILMHDLAKKHGPIFTIPMIGQENIVVVADYESIYQVSVLEGKICGGRPTSFRPDTILGNTGILGSIEPDETWKSLRKTSQRHLRQFGDGLSRLEAIIMDIAEDMFSTFKDEAEREFDPRQVIFDTALNSIAFLIIGQRLTLGDPVLEDMKEYEKLFLDLVPLSASITLKSLDAFPWLRHVGWPKWNLFIRLLELENRIWSNANAYTIENPDAESIYRVFRDHISGGSHNINDKDAKKATMALLLAGVTTTSNSFYATINILAHHQDIQMKVFDEIEKTRKMTGREVNLSDRPKMDYTRAVLLELLRHTSAVSNGVPHQTLDDVQIGQYRIPKGTTILISIWSMHHDEKFWNEPYSFRPNRFLDEEGKLVPADHPNRKHLMPFGAGPRVCLGESLAATRLFLWLVTMIGRFQVTPAKHNSKSSADPRNFAYAGVLQPPPFNVIFTNRV